MNPNKPLLQPLDPPAGGLEGLRQRLRRRQLRHGTVTAVLVTGLALAWFATIEDPAMTSPAIVKSNPLGRLVWVEPTEAVRIVNGVAVEWPSSSAKTRIYLVDRLN